MHDEVSCASEHKRAKAEVAKTAAPTPTSFLRSPVRCATFLNVCRILRRSGISYTLRTTTPWCQRKLSQGAERRSFALGSTTRRSPRLQLHHRSTICGCSMSVATNNQTICRYAMMATIGHTCASVRSHFLRFVLLRRCPFLLGFFRRTTNCRFHRPPNHSPHRLPSNRTKSASRSKTC